MPTMPTPSDRPDRTRRWEAVGALLLLAVAVVVAVTAVPGNVVRILLFPVLLAVVVMSAWTALTRTGPTRWAASAVGAVGSVAIVALVLSGDAHGLQLLVVIAAAVGSVVLADRALEPTVRRLAAEQHRFTPVGPARAPVLVVNPKSGGGKAAKAGLADAARARGIRVVELGPGDDLRDVVELAVQDDTDVIGMAGGDGSQALVASMAAERGIAMVCISAGTRNHFALDLGLDRDDLLAGLDAFGDADERRIDLGFVEDRVFVNNVAFGVYATIVQSPEYRDAKAATTTKMLSDLFAPGAEPFGFRFRTPDGTVHERAQIIEVSNNPYEIGRLGAFGTRKRLDTGRLGIITLEISGAADLPKLLALESVGRLSEFRGFLRWEAPEFVIEADAEIAVGIDGEALRMTPPLVLRSHPGAVRIRVPRSATGAALKAVRPRSWSWTLGALLRVAAGKDLEAADT